MKKLLTNWWLVSGLIALLAIVLLAIGLPIAVSWFQPLAWRIGATMAVLAIWGALAALRILAARSAADRIAAALAEREGQGEAGQVAERMRKAVDTLKSSGGGRRDYLYSRPWYVIIGPPGAGKSTALQNSGLKFPFSDVVLKGVGGTRNLDFWFADEAVLVDTAGRYSTQDSGDADKDGWNSFIDLLRKNRPLAPLNGVLVAIGLDTLMAGNDAAQESHALAIRRRLSELRAKLETDVPVYLLLTKTDLLAGFSEFFADLDPEGRRAVLGTTFAEGGSANVAQAFDDVAQSVMDRSAKRLQDELDGRRRGMILGFPGQFATVRTRLVDFIQAVFPENAQEGRAALRGFYFTSGVQQGAPFDLLLRGMASVQDAPQPPASGGARAYFINRLLTEVVLGEAGLAAATPQARQRRATSLVAAMAGVATVAVLVLIAFAVSFVGNRGLQDRTLAKAQAAREQIRSLGLDLAEVRETDLGLEESLPVLDALRQLPRGYAERRKGGPPLTETFGLYQSGLSRTAEQTYVETVERVLSPRILLRLERYQRQHASEPIALYEPLKAYLLLGGQHPIEPKAVSAWATRDWATDSLPGEDRADVRKRLGEHLDALLAERGLGHVWPDSQAPLDATLIADSRQKIETLPLADRAYAILKQKASTAAAPDWRLADVLSGGQIQAFQSPELARQTVAPALFTKRGYAEIYQPGLQTVQIDLQRDLWVMGGDQNKEGVRAQMQDLKAGIANRYATDYIATWKTVLQAVRPGDYFSNSSAASAVLAQPSPIKVVLKQVREQTAFAAAGAPNPAQDKIKAALGPAAGVVAGAMNSDAGKQINDAFASLGPYVDGQLDDFLAKLKQALEAKVLLDRSGGGPGGDQARTQFDQAMAALQVAGTGAPDDVKGFAGQAAKQGDAAGAAAIGGADARAWQPVETDCNTVVNGRYPFTRTSQVDTPVGDMLRVFGPASSMESFRTRIQPYLEITGSAWRWRSGDPIAASFQQASAQQFQRAGQIRDILAAGVPFQVQVESLGSGVQGVELSIGGNSARFQSAQSDRRAFQWSPQGLQEARLVIDTGGGKTKTLVNASGPWSAFRLFDGGRMENAGPTAFKVAFGDGAEAVTLRVILNSDVNPFNRGGPFLFKCPSRL